MIVLISIFDTIVNLYKPRIPGQLYQICIKITIFNISRRDKNKERAKSQRLSSFFVVALEGQPFHYKCGAVDWNGKEIIPAEYAAIGLTDYSVFRCYTGAEYDWGRNHQMDSLKYDGNPYLWKNSRNETLSKQLQIWRNKQQVANYNGWLILDNQILLNPELESQKWVSDKDLNFIQVTPGGTLITKDKRGKYGLRDLYGKSIILQIYDDMKLMASGIVVLGYSQQIDPLWII